MHHRRRTINLLPDSHFKTMKLEHIALNHHDPAAVAAWYVEHLGLHIVRVGDNAPYAHFLGDDSGQVLLELYAHDVAVPEYASLHVLSIHLAFLSENVTADTLRLTKAGASMVEPAKTTPRGDTFSMLRDPWGVPIQLVQRATAMIGSLAL